MARTLTIPGPLDTLEDAFDLLQRAPTRAWLRYLAGSGPLIVGLLYVLNEFSGSDGVSHNPMSASLFLVALLVWFYRCRQGFAGYLRQILSLTSPEDRPLHGWALACFEGTKLLAMPLAMVSMLPLAGATAFYRSLTLFAAEGLSPGEAAAKAWKTCVVWQRENWFVLAIVNLLSVAVAANIGLTVIIAPTLVKIFTGYENIFTERGSASLGIPIVLALTWLCFDPLLEAIYVVRAFKWEGLRSGEDLLVRLKRLVPLLILAAIGAAGCNLSAAPQEPALSRENLDQTIDQTLQSRDYYWRIPTSAPGAEQKDWFIDAVDQVLDVLHKGVKAVSDLWSDLMQWIDRELHHVLPGMHDTRRGQPSVVRPVFYVVGAAILALALVLLWKFGPRRKTPVPAAALGPQTLDLTNESLLASDLPEDEWLRMAESYAGSGDLRLALRALFLGTLALLNHRGLLTVHACKSNRDYEGELRRRSRDSGLTQIFRLNVRSFERSWYGFHQVTGEQLQNFRENLGRIRGYAG